MYDEKARQQELAALKSEFPDFKDLTDSNFGKFTSLLTAHSRAVETEREDALFQDQFAEMLAGKEGEALSAFVGRGLKAGEGFANVLKTYISLRTRFVDEALMQRPATIKQVVLLGAGLDSHAFRMETLRDCSFFELDAGTAMQDRKAKVFAENGVKPITKDYHVIIRNLEEDGWEKELQAHGYDPQVPTFWLLEGFLPYVSEVGIKKLLHQVDAISAPDSQLWADLGPRSALNVLDAGESSEHWKEALQFTDDDPLHGILTTLKWSLQVQANMGKEGEYFGRWWSPTGRKASGEEQASKNPFEIYFMLATKPNSNAQ